MSKVEGRKVGSKAPAKPHFRFTSLYLENWRNFTHDDVPLQARVFIVGPNASGKSNLLDVFRFLHDIVAVGGGFQEAVRKRGDVSRLRCLAARRHPEVAIRVGVGNDAHPLAWQYELRFDQKSKQKPKVSLEKITHAGEVILERPNAEDTSDPERLTQTYLEQVSANQRFREVVEFLGSVRYRHIVPQLVREPERSVGRSNDPYGGDFLDQIAGTSEKERKARLSRIREALSVAVPQLAVLDLIRDERGRPHLQGNYRHWRPRGAWQTEDQFSDGTLRLMGLLWSMQEGGGPLLLEEPELSLHPDVVRYIPSMLARVAGRRNRQVFVSSHSSELLRDEGIAPDEVLMLRPGDEGTNVQRVQDDVEARREIEAGLDMADVVLPRTRPAEARQLAFFGR